MQKNQEVVTSMFKKVVSFENNIAVMTKFYFLGILVYKSLIDKRCK